MLGIGWTEMLVVGVVALIVIGPKELPALMQKLGRFAGTVRRMGTDFQREINKTTGLDEVRNLRTSITQPLKATTDAIRKEFNTTTAGVTKPSGALKPANPAAESVVDEIHAAAGIKPAQTAAESMKEAVGKGVAASAAASKAAATKTTASGKARPQEKPKVPVKAARLPRAKPAPTMPVTSADLQPVTQAPKASPAGKVKPIESPAPVEAIPPRPKRTAAKPVAAESVSGPKPAAKRKPAARKS